MPERIDLMKDERPERIDLIKDERIDLMNADFASNIKNYHNYVINWQNSITYSR